MARSVFSFRGRVSARSAGAGAHGHSVLPIVGLCSALALVACRAPESEISAHRASSLLHLTDRLDDAAILSAGSPEHARQERRWIFDRPRPDWRTVSYADLPELSGVELARLDDAVELSLTRGRGPDVLRIGGLATELGELRYEDWESVLVHARSTDRFAGMAVVVNLNGASTLPDPRHFFNSVDEINPVFSDGSEQTYAIPLRHRGGGSPPAVLSNIALLFAAPGPASVDVLAVGLVPRGAAFLDDSGLRSVTRGGTTRDTLFAHAPARLTFPLEIPSGGRLDVGLGVSPQEQVTYRISTEHDGRRQVWLEETVDDSTSWRQRSVDLSSLAHSTVRLILEADSEQAGAVALWGAPILSGKVQEERPNVIFYVIDAGDANLMSLYGYGRPTTPFLEQLAREGAVFTRAYSSATWTQPSTVSFMTSLHHSVVGGLRRGVHSTAVPATATTMAEHFRTAGYQTMSLTANPNAGRLIGLERGVDLMRDGETEHHSTSSSELHEQFWHLRQGYPGGPLWAHFQTTDVHEPHFPDESFAGRFVTAEERSELDAWTGEFWRAGASHFGKTSVDAFYNQTFERAGIDRRAYLDTRRGLYDETMVYQDHTLRQLVSQLKETGEWQNTLLVVGSDHGHPAGTFARFGRGLLEPQPEPWQGALFDAYATRVPLIVIWPGHIPAGKRFEQPVSMIDVLPTLLDLLDLPRPEIMQGQSLASLLMGDDATLRPVILDEFRVDETSGEMVGNLELIDGRWGASLEIGPVREGSSPSQGRHAVPAGGRWGAVHPYFPDVPRLLLYDLEQDPFASRAVNDAHPELVRRYGRQLMEIWESHQALAGQFSSADAVPLDPEQLQQLRALGYIQ